MKNALIIGSEGQDGKLLSSFLREKKEYHITGIGRQESSQFELDDYYRIDLIEPSEILRIFQRFYDEIYYLAAYHHSSQTNLDYERSSLVTSSINVNVLSFATILEHLHRNKLKSKVFYASSSLIYEGSNDYTQSESTVQVPLSIYAISKQCSMNIARYYRNEHNLFVSTGILYNHESILRGNQFLSKIIIQGVHDVLSGKLEKLEIGDLNAQTDWGYAPDYVQAMWHLLQLDSPDDYIVSTGQLRRVKDWLDVLANHCGFNWHEYVVENPGLLKRKKRPMIGNNQKILNTGWEPETSFEDMVIKMFEGKL